MKSIDVVNRVISQNKDLSVKTVATINKYYWKAVRNKISNLETTAIFVRGLLTFTASRYNVNVLIKKTIHSIRITKSSTKYGEIKRNAILEDNYINLRLLLKQRNEIAKQYYEYNR